MPSRWFLERLGSWGWEGVSANREPGDRRVVYDRGMREVVGE